MSADPIMFELDADQLLRAASLRHVEHIRWTPCPHCDEPMPDDVLVCPNCGGERQQAA